VTFLLGVWAFAKAKPSRNKLVNKIVFTWSKFVFILLNFSFRKEDHPLKKSRVSYLRRTAQPPALASFQTWGSSAGAGRTRLTPHKNRKKVEFSSSNITSSH